MTNQHDVLIPSFSNDSIDAEPEEKRRKTSNVVIDQSASDVKVVIDNVRDTSSSLEEVKDVFCAVLDESLMGCYPLENQTYKESRPNADLCIGTGVVYSGEGRLKHVLFCLCLQTQEWPLESFCEELCNDLFNPSWEVNGIIHWMVFDIQFTSIAHLISTWVNI